MSETHPALLPNGLKDLLPPEAEEEARIITCLMDSFSAFGYRRVKPPLVEFEESLLAPGPGKALARDTFRLMDPVSQHMMGVRADTTAQIARIAGSRLKQTPRPLRLSYAVDVLRVNGSQLRPERQFCQVGCELIGAGDFRDDVEISLMALKALKDVGVENLSIDLTIPSLIDTLFDEFKIESVERNKLESLIQKRDRDGLKSVKGKATEALVQLLDCSGLAREAMTGLKKVKLPKAAQANIKLLSKVYDDLLGALKTYGMDNINLTIDLIERRGFEYQNGVSFTLFAPQVRGELGRGGRYRVAGDSDEDATGFTLYMDSVRQAVKTPQDQNRKVLNRNASWEDIKNLQDQGYLVSRGGSEEK
ncbi:MAG TPA: ATP phosphoribosyltransferase regulatory subunit [Alphaproteobacteria bacterium]|nr:ATP phosphoribosyltransferase regulatory subunit [Alphaproteobacteria bacterium]